MNFKILLLASTTVLAITAKSQQQATEEKSATKAGVNVINTNPDKGRKASIYAGAFGPEGVDFLGASYYKPKSLYVNGMAGLTGGMIDGSFFLQSKMKASKLKQTVKLNASDTASKVVITAPLEKRKSFGLHAGANYIDYSQFPSNGVNTFSANGVFGGVTLLSAGHAKWVRNSDRKETQGTTIGRINADVIYYTNRKLIATNDGKDQRQIDDLSRKVGFRIYCDGKTSVWSRNGRMAIHYMIGAGTNSDKTRNVAMFAGVGIGYNFL